MSSLILRPAMAGDAAGVIALIDGVYREYGDRVCLDDADSDLLAPHTCYATQGGEFVVLTDDERIIGTHAVVPLPAQPGVCTFRRLYLDPAYRGSGAGAQLMHWALARAKALGFRRVEFWSDTRFSRAHTFFRRFGFEADGRVREMTDSFEPYREYFFACDLTRLDLPQ